MTNIDANFGQRLLLEDGNIYTKVNLEDICIYLNAENPYQGLKVSTLGFNPMQAALLTPDGRIISGVYECEVVEDFI